MQKIISLFQRNYEGDRLVRDEVVPGAEWVIAGDGVATRKWDGTPVLINNGKMYKRYDVKPGKTAPEGSIQISEKPDPNTGHWPWWAPVGDGTEDRLFREAFAFGSAIGEQAGPYGRLLPLNDGTYELCGPRVNGNKDGFKEHRLVKHGVQEWNSAPKTYAELKAWFADQPIEGIVWHHPDGRMVKIKKKDFGYKW